MTKVKAQLNNLRVSPRKVQCVVTPLRGKRVADALSMLDFDVRHVAAPLAKLIRSAQANAIHNFKLSEGDLMIAEIAVGAGPTLKRWRPRAYGRASKILKRTSRISVVLVSIKEENAPKKEVKKVTKNVTKKATKNVVKKATKKAIKDDLTKIEGIGPKIAAALATAKITTFAALASAKKDDLVAAIADVAGTHDPTTWPTQAQLAADGKWEDLEALQEKLLGGKNNNSTK